MARLNVFSLTVRSQVPVSLRDEMQATFRAIVEHNDRPTEKWIKDVFRSAFSRRSVEIVGDVVEQVHRGLLCVRASMADGVLRLELVGVDEANAFISHEYTGYETIVEDTVLTEAPDSG